MWAKKSAGVSLLMRVAPWLAEIARAIGDEDTRTLSSIVQINNRKSDREGRMEKERERVYWPVEDFLELVLGDELAEVGDKEGGAGRVADGDARLRGRGADGRGQRRRG